MKVTRVYADERGDSRFDGKGIELADAGTIGHFSEPSPADQTWTTE